MTFKSKWEQSHTQHSLSHERLAAFFSKAYPNKTLSQASIISGGCANLNYKITTLEDPHPLLLRIYLRDKDAAHREKALGLLLANEIPLPQTKYIGVENEYTFAFTSFMPGKSLREVLLHERCDVQKIMFDVGVCLSKIASHHFPQSGFLDKDLKVQTPFKKDDLLEFGIECLSHDSVKGLFSSEIIQKINDIFIQHANAFPDVSHASLVHGDFDPANILVQQSGNEWTISGILDWEFAFSGSMLCDVANMLRYAHQMPNVYRQAFLEGLHIELPDNWETTVNVLNLLSLLDCLKRSDPISRPNQHADIGELILRIASILGA